MDYLIGIDNGGTLAKAALYDLAGREVALASRRFSDSIPRPGFVERDAVAMRQANLAAVRELLEVSGVRGGQIAGIGCTGFGNGLFLLGEDGAPTHPAIVSSDVRAQWILDEWLERGVNEVIMRHAGSTPWAGQSTPLVAWMLRHAPEVARRTRWYLSCTDFLRYILTGEVTRELTDTSTLGIVDLDTKQISEEILGAEGLLGERHKFAPMGYATEPLGHVSAEAAGATGLVEGTPVCGGTIDILTCALSGGLLTEGMFNLVVGSWGIHQCLSRVRVDTPLRNMTAFSYLPDQYLIMEGSPTGTNNLEWFIKNALAPGGAGAALGRAGGEAGKAGIVANADTAAAADTNVYQLCDTLAAGVAPDPEGVVFLPFLYATNGVPHATAGFYGVTSWHTNAHLLRAVYEGIAFSSRYHCERLPAWGAEGRATITGGATRSPVFLQLYADVLGRPIETMGGSEERGALGAAMMAGIACGAFDSPEQAAARMTHISGLVAPDPQNAAIYDKLYARYKQAMRAADLFTNAERAGARPIE